jgi:hypothetical protein
LCELKRRLLLILPLISFSQALFSALSSTDHSLDKLDVPTIALTGLDSNDVTAVSAHHESVEFFDCNEDRGYEHVPSMDAPDNKYEPPNVYSISFSTVESSGSRDPPLERIRGPSKAGETLCSIKMQSLLNTCTESTDFPSPTANEAVIPNHTVVPIGKTEAAKSDSDPSCGLCFCLKSDTDLITSSDNAQGLGRDARVSDPFHGLSMAEDTTMGAVEPSGATPVVADASGKDVCDYHSSPEKEPRFIEDVKRTRRPPSSMRVLGIASPSMSTDSEKDYVPDSLRVFVAEATLALHEEHRSFLTSVKEDNTFDTEDGHKANSSSAAIKAVPCILSLLAAEIPNAISRQLLTPTARFQVLSNGEATKDQKPIAQSAPRTASKTFCSLSTIPPPFDPALEDMYTPLLVRYGPCLLAQGNGKDVIPHVFGAGDAVVAPSALDTFESSGRRLLYFGNSGPSSSAFYFGNSASATLNDDGDPVSLPFGPAAHAASAFPTMSPASKSSISHNTFYFGRASGQAGIQPVVFDFANREARERAYFRYGGALCSINGGEEA